MIYVVWGSTYYFIGVALKELTPMLLGAIRFTLAGSLLFLWSAIRMILLKGSGFMDIFNEFLGLTIYGITVLMLAVRAYRKRS